MSPLFKIVAAESGEGLVNYVLVLAPLAAVVALVIVTLIMSETTSR